MALTQTPRSPVILALLTAAAVSACSSSPLPSIGSINPFSKSIPDTDRVFLMAAGSWDRNRDNNVTCDEWKSYATELFNGADANADESVDQSEWGSITKVDRMFDTADLSYYDASRDGKVTRAEFIEKPNPAFALLDPGKTCTLSGAQVAGARSKTQYDLTAKPKEDDAGGKTPDAITGKR